MTALVLNIFVDLAGAIPTIRSVARDPMSESRSAWSIFLVANTLNLMALTTLSLEHSLYPVYLFLLSAVITVLAVRRPRRLA
jgi:hypothetical protein